MLNIPGAYVPCDHPWGKSLGFAHCEGEACFAIRAGKWGERDDYALCQNCQIYAQNHAEELRPEQIDPGFSFIMRIRPDLAGMIRRAFGAMQRQEGGSSDDWTR